MPRKYGNPPVVEAVCEFRFEPGDWDSAIFGLVWEEVKGHFPKRRDVQQSGLQVQVELRLVPTPPSTEQQTAPEPRPRVQYLSDDGKSFLIVGPDVLSVNRLAPYSSWQDLKPLARRGFDAYVSHARPKAIRRAGLRYINRMEFPGEKIKLDDYFNFRPFLGTTLPQDHASFILGVEFIYPPAGDALRLQLASVRPAKEQRLAVILDLDYFTLLPDSIRVQSDEAVNWLDRAHGRVEEIFEGTITDRLRSMFGGEA